MSKERGAYQFQWLIHHPSSVNGSIKKEQCAVGLHDSDMVEFAAWAASFARLAVAE